MEKSKCLVIFDPVLFYFRITGLWPMKDSYAFDLYTFYSVLCVSLFIFANTVFQSLNLFMVEMDLQVFAAAILVASHIMAVVKVFGFLRNIGLIKALIKKIDDQILQPKNERQLKLLEENLRIWMMIYRTFQVGVGVMATFWLLRPILEKSYKNYELPLFAWYPFDIKRMPYYQIAYLYQIIGVWFVGISNMNLDSFSAALMVYVGVQCDILCDSLKEIRTLSDLVLCIKHHKKIIRFVEDVNGFLGNLVLGQFFTSTGTIAITLFKLTLATPGSTEFYTVLIFALVATLQLFMYCWFGNEAELKSNKIPSGVFDSQWIGSSLEFQKTMLIFMIRTQNHISITAFGLFPLSLQTFMAIIRSSWSYFAVLNQMNSPEP